MQVGDLIKFKKTGAFALVLKINHCPVENYTSVYLQVLGDVLSNTACAGGFTWMSGRMIERGAEVVGHASG